MNIFLFKNREVAKKNKPVHSGFTLIELITVIVILSILASIGTGFVVSATESYQRTQTRALLVNTARQALERMTRQLRIALPYSVLPVNNKNCIKFMPIAGGGNYIDGNPVTEIIDPVPDVINDAPAGNEIIVSPVVIDFGVPRYVAIGAMSDGEVYGSTRESITGYAGHHNDNTKTILQLNPAKKWLRNSINKRYYLLNNPQAFCLVGTELRFYDDISVVDSDVDVTAPFSIIARDVTGTNPFGLQNGSENRSMRVDISLVFSSAGESINYTQGVFIRNVP